MTREQPLPVVQVPRAWEPAGPDRFLLHPLTGAVESTCSPAGAASPMLVAELLDAVVRPVGATGEVASTWSASSVALPTRDRLLAAIYRATMGPAVEQHRTCTGCGADLEVSFELDHLLEACSPDLSDVELLPDGRLRSEDVVVRVPRCEDLLVCATPHELASRCLQGAVSPSARTGAGALLQRAAPLLDVDLDVSCDVCGTASPWRFEIADHVFRSFHRERPILLREIDLLARTYAWSLDEVLRLPRSDRHQFVALVASASRQAS